MRRPRPPRATAILRDPITIIVPFPPGGSSDIVTRAVSTKVAESAEAADRDREPSRRRRRCRRLIATKQARAGRLHRCFSPTTDCLRSRRQSSTGRSLRPGQGLPADHAACAVSKRSDRAGRLAGADRSGTCSTTAQSKPVGLSFASQGLGSGGPYPGRTAAAQDPALSMHACPLSRRGTGGAGPGRRQCRHAVFLVHFRRRARSRPARRACIAFTGPKRSPILLRRADHGRAGLCRHRDGRLARHRRAARDTSASNREAVSTRSSRRPRRPPTSCR